MAQSIEYEVTVNDTRKRRSFRPADVNDERVATDRAVARAYAQHLAVKEFGFSIDVQTVELVNYGE